MGSQCLDFDSVELGRLAGLWPDGQKTVFGRSGGAGGFDDQDLGREVIGLKFRGRISPLMPPYTVDRWKFLGRVGLKMARVR
ncbi:MAG: hypothetical protein UW84_C0022G0008 [Candidatus Collierbacteria bacterium GW2011_GWA2_44_99]|uniref:Uncharacterized protein n=1 Tax=Candidatus Collierbacteria bacterium GW2011_GWA2_44_99 TaxID=1618380 RepID=A0A0G1KQ39_9BACT|nr:MAG: hypothetical protein UW84_C0022G0008 [Candidatus Collierbacteria bacterium GW2011_GWA2_44_99]